MLTQITVKNLAIVDSLELEFNSGLSVLTGETGAGKSILIDALSLVLGDRADSSLVRTGAKRADITACFDLSKQKSIAKWLEENDLSDEADEKECILRRSINQNGRSKGYVNGQAVPLQILRELGEQLINIHGQNSHQQLLHHQNQRQLLDDHAHLFTLNKELNGVFLQWKNKSKEYAQLKAQQQDQFQQIELLSYQLDELEQFEPIQGELKGLEEEYKKLNHASETNEKLNDLFQQLSDGGSFSLQGSSQQQSVLQVLSHCDKTLEEVSAYDESLKEVQEMLSQALIQVEEASQEISHRLSATELDPDQLDQLNERISLYHELSRKHQSNPYELLAKFEELKAQLSKLENSDTYLGELEGQINNLYDNYFKLAQQLSKGRKNAASELSTLVEKHIHDLGMEQAKFSIDLKPTIGSSLSESKRQPVKDGLEQIFFMVSTNPGQATGLLSKIASGGELSRISLAIQVVTAQYSQIPTLIFDEIDVGVGGKIAEMIGAKLHLLGKQAQILCVTHQAQVAAHGDQHFQVEKNTKDQTTVSTIEALTMDHRIDELARMMGGKSITDATRSLALEMFEQARD
jgi:DNA repair protein RecN (Recombination protein N)